MVLRTLKPPDSRKGSENEAWEAFAPSQATDGSILGFVTQPAHAALAGRLAAVLNGQLFGEIPAEVIAIIGSHDTGWAEVDLAALEDARSTPPISFLSTPSAIAVRAWRRSITEAETKSALSGYVVRSHFCLLAPRDEDAEHLLFREEEEAELRRISPNPKYDVHDLKHFIAFLGFCDLLSLHLCSGWPGNFKLPLAHPAHPSAKDAPRISISINEGVVHVSETKVLQGTSVHVNGWKTTQSGTLQNQRYEWKFR
jgi:hypothetical protein